MKEMRGERTSESKESCRKPKGSKFMESQDRAGEYCVWVCVGVRKRECVHRDAYMAEILIHRLEIVYYVYNIHMYY